MRVPRKGHHPPAKGTFFCRNAHIFGAAHPINFIKIDKIYKNKDSKRGEFCLIKKIGNKIATNITRLVSGFKVQDGQSGFRAFSREAALRMNILSNYTYVQETIIQAVFKNLKIIEVPVHFKKRKDKSRLISSIWKYGLKAGMTILRTYLAYKPLKFFGGLGFISGLAGLFFGSKVLFHYKNKAAGYPAACSSF